MGINKNFVVRHGFEASTDLILADADTRKVGIGTTRPSYDLTVAGGIGATDFYLTGIGTFVDTLNVGLGGTVLTVLGLGNSVGIGTTLPAYLVDIRSPVLEGQTALYVQGDVRITGDIQADDITFDDAEIQDLTVTDTFIVAGLSTFNSNVFIDAELNVSGITTLGGYVDINDDVDISGAINVSGISTLGGYVDINNSVDIAVDLNVGGITTLGNYVNILSDLNVSGITTLATVDINDGEIDVSRIQTGNLSVTGIATIATVDINDGEIDVSRIQTGNLSVTGIATIETISVVSAELSNLTVSGIATVENISINNLNVSGISTLGFVEISTGIITATSGVVTYYGDGSNLLNLPPGSPSGSNSEVQYNNNGSFAGSPNFTFDGSNINVVGVITALEFYGDGSNLTGIGVTRALTIGTRTIAYEVNAVGTGIEIQLRSGIGTATF
jgi:hypothetical protein